MNGYIAIEIGSEKVGLKFGMPANRWFSEKLQKDPEIISGDNNTNELGIAWLIFYGYKNNCKLSDKEETLTYGKFLEWVEEAMVDKERKAKLEEVAICYAESKYTKQHVSDINAATEEIKKKMIGILSNPSATENLDSAQEITGV